MGRVLPLPWSLLAPRHSPSADMSIDDSDRCGLLNPETATFYTRSDEHPPHLVPSRENAAAWLSEGVAINPLTDLGRRPGRLWVVPWPYDGSTEWRVRFGSDENSIPVSGGLRRADGREEPTEVNAQAVFFREAIDCLCGYFTEAISLTLDRKQGSFAVFSGQPVVKLDWFAIWSRWSAAAAGTEPRMARVVEIALSHLSGIRDVCERPRRMLIRQRELVPVGKIQELDETCLRDLVRRPGRSVAEKAGFRQELLGITRRESVDTAENRVIRDFVRLCMHRAGAYERENRRSSRHRKVRAVAELRRNCGRFDSFAPIASAARLVGAPRANYVLQKDRRYHNLWVQYDKLRKEEVAIDSIWPWGRRLWADFVRGLFVGFLSAQAAEKSARWKLLGSLPAYVRAEHDFGSFIPPLAVSSRWKHCESDEELWVIHGADAHLCPGLHLTLPRIGADLAIACFDPKRGYREPVGLLTIHSVLSLNTTRETRETVVDSLATALDVVAHTHPGIARVNGILLRGEYMPEMKSESRHVRRLDYLSAGAGGDYWFKDFPELVSVLLEELRG